MMTPWRRLGELGLVGLAIVAAVAPLNPGVAERWFSTTTYPRIQRVLTPLSNLTGFGVLDVMMLLALAAVGLVIIRATRSSLRDRRVQPIAATLWHLLVAAAVTYLLFLV